VQKPVVVGQQVFQPDDLLVLQGIGQGYGKGLVQDGDEIRMIFSEPVQAFRHDDQNSDTFAFQLETENQDRYIVALGVTVFGQTILGQPVNGIRDSIRRRVVEHGDLSHGRPEIAQFVADPIRQGFAQLGVVGHRPVSDVGHLGLFVRFRVIKAEV